MALAVADAILYFFLDRGILGDRVFIQNGLLPLKKPRPRRKVQLILTLPAVIFPCKLTIIDPRNGADGASAHFLDLGHLAEAVVLLPKHLLNQVVLVDSVHKD